MPDTARIRLFKGPARTAPRPTLKLPLPPEFWMVWYTGSNRIRRQHATEAEAIAEARRLAAKHPGREFWVLRSVLRTGTAKRVPNE